MATVRIAAAQTPDFREDLDGALDCLTGFAADAEAQGAALLCFPETFLQGYLLEDALARRHALDLASPAFQAVLDRLPRTGPVLVIGLIELESGNLNNTAVVVEGGALVGRYRKTHLMRGEAIFMAGTRAPVFRAGGLSFGMNICYDSNFPQAAQAVADGGATLIVCPSNNMHRRQVSETYRHLHNAVRGDRCRETGLWLISSDVTGERDDKISWGPTAVLDPTGVVAAQLPLDRPGLLIFDLPLT